MVVRHEVINLISDLQRLIVSINLILKVKEDRFWAIVYADDAEIKRIEKYYLQSRLTEKFNELWVSLIQRSAAGNKPYRHISSHISPAILFCI